jgi:hypothetical protein
LGVGVLGVAGFSDGVAVSKLARFSVCATFAFFDCLSAVLRSTPALRAASRTPPFLPRPPLAFLGILQNKTSRTSKMSALIVLKLDKRIVDMTGKRCGFLVVEVIAPSKRRTADHLWLIGIAAATLEKH